MLTETIEKLRSSLDLPENAFLDLFGIPWSEYFLFKTEARDLAPKHISSLAQFCKTDESSLFAGRVDFAQIVKRHAPERTTIPERYMVAPHGRCRTTLTSLNYLEERYGWRLKFDVLNKFKISEPALSNPFAPVSMRLITEICDYLKSRRFSERDFFLMGGYSFVGNKDSAVGRYFAELNDVFAIYDHFWGGECLSFFERNCIYRVHRTGETSLIITVASHPEVCEELGVRHLGSTQICSLKAGIMATVPCYLGLKPAKVSETACAHRGNELCRFEIDFGDAGQIDEVTRPGSAPLRSH